jgi:hypothetical protein
MGIALLVTPLKGCAFATINKPTVDRDVDE